MRGFGPCANCYSRRDDPLAWNDLVRNLGKSRRQLLGGTIALVDRDLKVRYYAEGEKIREAPDQLARRLSF